MMIAIPEAEWHIFSRMRPAEMVATLRELAQKVQLKASVVENDTKRLSLLV
jgi:hypothetical protein